MALAYHILQEPYEGKLSRTDLKTGGGEKPPSSLTLGYKIELLTQVKLLFWSNLTLGRPRSVKC